MLKLKMITGPSIDQEYPLPEQGTVVLGRRSSCDVQVVDPKASRVHAEISAAGGFLYVRDMGSRNGTLLNGRRIDPDTLEVLEAGDRIAIGDITFEVFDDSAEEIPKVEISGYEVIDVIGRGGMGTVYKARQVSMDRIVAAKVLHPELCEDANFINRFVQEARAAGRLSHPNIIHVFDVDKLDGSYYFTMEYVDGGNVKRAIREKGHIPVQDAGRMLLQAAKALAYAHGQGVIHRDVKPDNLMLTRDGSIKLADLGIARTFEEPGTKGERASKVYGTPHYMAPEQALGKPVDARVDIYSLGATFYNMLTGRTPFTGASVTEVLKAHVQEALPPITEYNPDVPEGICHVCERMMAKKPEKRYQTMEEVVADLETALRDQSAKIAAPDPSESSVIPAASAQALEFRRKRALRRQPAWKKAMSWSVTLIFFAALFIGTFLVVRMFIEPPQQQHARRDPSLELRDKAEKALAAADDAIARGELQAALAQLQDIFRLYPEFPDISEKASNYIERVKGMIAETRRQAAQAALEEATSFYNQNPGERRRALERFEKILNTWPETAAAVLAKVKAAEIRDEMDKTTAGAQSQEFRRVMAEAGGLVARRDYDAAIQKVREFAARYAGTEAGNEASAAAASFEQEVENVYRNAEKEAGQRRDKKEFGLAVAALDQFSKTYISVKWREEANKLKGRIQQEAMKQFEEDCREPNELVKQFRFEDAIAKLSMIRARYEGTQWGIFLAMRLASIQAQADIHGEVRHKIKMLAKGGEAPRLPFEMKNFPRVRFRVVDADGQQVFLESESEPKFRQPFKWMDLAADQIYQIYRLYIPNPTGEQHSWLGYFCQERDLIDKAEEHFNKADQ
ncbi:MAG TPA: FHA domain-containing protein [Planctomycetes bacterium]|nr:FHA domain-containing protein [Planctomycetota bacterium]